MMATPGFLSVWSQKIVAAGYDANVSTSLDPLSGIGS